MQWDLILKHIEFSYNNSTNQARKCPFEVVYGMHPLIPLDLTPSPSTQKYIADAEQKTNEIKKLHEQVRERFEKQNSRYKT